MDMLDHHICIVDVHLVWYSVPQVSAEVLTDEAFQHHGFYPLLRNVDF